MFLTDEEKKNKYIQIKSGKGYEIVKVDDINNGTLYKEIRDLNERLNDIENKQNDIINKLEELEGWIKRTYYIASI